MAIADEVSIGEQVPDEVWTSIAEKKLSNLAKYDYFTAVKADGAAVKLGEVSRFEGGLRDGRMWMRFEVPLAEPIDPRSQAVCFAVYDPTYYIEIVHIEGGDRCVGDILQPNPTLEQVSLAASC